MCSLTSALLSPRDRSEVTGGGLCHMTAWESLNPNTSYLMRPCQYTIERKNQSCFFFPVDFEALMKSRSSPLLFHFPDMKSNDCSSLIISFPWVSKAPLNIPLGKNTLESNTALLLIWWTLGELWPFPLTGPAVCELCTRRSCREKPGGKTLPDLMERQLSGGGRGGGGQGLE